MKTSTPVVSIIMPAFNAVGFLERAIASVQSQTLSNWELIIVDDASTDDTAKEVKTIAAADNRVKLLRHRTNGGPSMARNKGLSTARGKWIAILDADDTMIPERLQRMIIAAETTQADILADNLYLYDAGAKRVVRTMLSQIQGILPLSLADLFRNDLPSSGSYYGWFKPLIRRAYLNRTGIRYRPEYRYGEDFLFYAELLIAGATAAIDTRPGYIYTTRVGELSKQASSQTRTIASSEQLIKAMDWLLFKHGHAFDSTTKKAIRFRRNQNQLAPIFADYKSALIQHPLKAALLLTQNPGLIWFIIRILDRVLRNWLTPYHPAETVSHGTPY